MKHNQPLRRGLGVLLALVLCLSLLPATALADDVQTMTIGDVVAENTPFKVDLGKILVSGVIVRCKKNGVSTKESWNQSEPSDQNWKIEGNYLTVGGKYVSASGQDSMVGMKLTGVEYDCLEIDYIDYSDSKNVTFLFSWNSEENKYECISYAGNLDAMVVIDASVSINESNGNLSFTLEDSIYNCSFDPDAARRAILTFENFPKLPTTAPLEAGVYYHLLKNDTNWDISKAYTVVCDAKGVYNSSEGSDVGWYIEKPDSTPVAELTVAADSVLDGATFTGDEYNAEMVTFTAADNSAKEMLVYLSSVDLEEEWTKQHIYKCINAGKIQDLTSEFEGNYFTLIYDENGVRYEAKSSEQYFVEFFPMTGTVLFFKAADSSTATYTVTVKDSYATATGAGTYEAGDVVTLAAGTRSGYTFSGWTSDNITIPNAASADTSFVMPAKAVIVTANWTKDGQIVVPGDPVKPADPVQPVIPFTDVPRGAYYEDAVLWAVSEGITSGMTASTFSPNAACTRAQAVTFLWRAAGCPAPKSAGMPFTDVAEGSYYYDAVLWAVEQGITKGTTGTTFSPDATCTRAQIVTFLYRCMK